MFVVVSDWISADKTPISVTMQPNQNTTTTVTATTYDKTRVQPWKLFGDVQSVASDAIQTTVGVASAELNCYSAENSG